MSQALRLNKQKKRFYIQTFGCQMNVADTERMTALLREKGMEASPSYQDVDLLLVNGCSVREKAVHKAVSALGRFRSLKEEGKGPIVGLGGCVGQLDQGAIFGSAPFVDFVFGPDAIENLPEIVHEVEQGKKHVVYTQFDRTRDYSTQTKVVPGKSQAFVNIMKGCDKFCTYCIVPFTRGREKSRSIDEVLNDVANLVERGVREVTLLGQNVNSFGKGNKNLKDRTPKKLLNPIGRVGPREDEENFPQLLRAIDGDERCSSLKRIRFTSSHPLDFSDELIECYSLDPNEGVFKLAPHLHLPVQSGSDRILRKMGRHHKIDTYVKQMDRLREVNPQVSLSTDLIVGFPSETEEDFEETLALLDRIQYDSVYAFAYSPRPGTRASKLEDDVPESEKKRRLNLLLEHQYVISEKVYRARIGKVFEVLVEGPAKNQNLVESGAKEPEPELKVWTGRTGCNRVVNFVSNSRRPLDGKFVNTRITGASSHSLTGELLLSPNLELESGIRNFKEGTI